MSSSRIDFRIRSPETKWQGDFDHGENPLRIGGTFPWKIVSICRLCPGRSGTSGRTFEYYRQFNSNRSRVELNLLQYDFFIVSPYFSGEKTDLSFFLGKSGALDSMLLKVRITMKSEKSKWHWTAKLHSTPVNSSRNRSQTALISQVSSDDSWRVKLANCKSSFVEACFLKNTAGSIWALILMDKG